MNAPISPKAQATLGPWRLVVCRTMAHIKNDAGALIASLHFKTDEEKANARLIVEACNERIGLMKRIKAYQSELQAAHERCDSREVCLREIASPSTGYMGGLDAKGCAEKARAALAQVQP